MLQNLLDSYVLIFTAFLCSKSQYYEGTKQKTATPGVEQWCSQKRRGQAVQDLRPDTVLTGRSKWVQFYDHVWKISQISHLKSLNMDKWLNWRHITRIVDFEACISLKLESPVRRPDSPRCSTVSFETSIEQRTHRFPWNQPCMRSFPSLCRSTSPPEEQSAETSLHTYRFKLADPRLGITLFKLLVRPKRIY